MFNEFIKKEFKQSSKHLELIKTSKKNSARVQAIKNAKSSKKF